MIVCVCMGFKAIVCCFVCIFVCILLMNVTYTHICTYTHTYFFVLLKMDPNTLESITKALEALAVAEMDSQWQELPEKRKHGRNNKKQPPPSVASVAAAAAAPVAPPPPPVLEKPVLPPVVVPINLKINEIGPTWQAVITFENGFTPIMVKHRYYGQLFVEIRRTLYREKIRKVILKKIDIENPTQQKLDWIIGEMEWQFRDRSVKKV